MVAICIGAMRSMSPAIAAGLVFITLSVIVVTICLTIMPGIGSVMDEEIGITDDITGVKVYFTDADTDATAFKVAIYDGIDHLQYTSSEASITGDAWDTATFSPAANLHDGRQYSFVISADGNYSIPGTLEGTEYYIYVENVTYGDFPSTITSTGKTGVLQIDTVT